MENKLPDDQLEHFLKNSFKDYSEKPSEDVWEKIDYTLDHQPLKFPSNKRWIWMLSAAALTGIILYLGANNIYLNNKLRKEIEINKSIAHTIQEPATENPDSKKIGPDQDVAAENKIALTKDSTSGAGKQDHMVSSSTESLKENASKTLIPSEVVSIPESLSTTRKTHKENSQSNLVTADPKENLSTVKQNSTKNNKSLDLSENQNIKQVIDHKNESGKLQNKNTKSNKAERSLPSSTGVITLNETKSGKVRDKNLIEKNPIKEEINKDASSESTIKEERLSNRSAIDLAYLASKESALTSLSPARTIRPGVFSNVIPVKIPATPHWSELNLQGGMIQESGSLTDLRKVNNPLVNPSENTFTTTNSWTAGLGFSKSLNKNWYVSTGLAFKNYELLNTINQSLIFGGRINPGSGMPLHHDWDFKLNCPGGTSNIMIQSEQLDSRATISDNEQVKVTINNKEKLNYLTIPVALNYRTTFGKLSLMGGAGLHMNILTMSSFEEPTIQIKHPQLKTRTEPHNRYRFDKSNPVVWNSTLSAGVAYTIAPRISLQLTPSWIIPITNRNSDRDVKVTSTSFAFQLGLNYSLASL